METKVPIEDAIHMSLDEYITKAEIIDPVGLSKARNRWQNANHQPSESDDGTSDVEMSVPAKEYFDFTSGDMPNPRSQQWRLMPLNIQADRPSGMPPLMPISAGNVQTSLRSRSAMNNVQQRQQDDVKTPPTASHAGHAQNGTTSKSNDLTIEVDIGASTTNGSHGDAGNRQRHGKRWRPNQKTRWNYNNNNSENGGGVMRHHNQFKHDRLNVHQRIDHSYLSRKQSFDQHPGMSQPMPTPPVNMSLAMQPFSSATLVAGIPSSIANATEATFVKHCIEAFPSVTSKLLEQIEAMHRAKLDKKYDIKVQKEIAEMQGKTLMYTCPGAAVVSSDGPGIETVAPQPHATDVSMNQRFA